MDLLDTPAILARLAALHDARVPDQPRAALAFDGDGTMWTGDVGEDFFHATVAAARYLPVAVGAMREVGRAAGLDGMEARDHDAHRDSGVAIAKRLFQGYLDHAVAEDVICEVIAWVCAGWRADDVTELARDTVERAGLAGRTHPELRAIVEWAYGAGVEAFLVSASPRPVVEAAVKAAGLGFDAGHILAATALFKDGVMLPDVARPIPYGRGKAALLAARLEGRELLAAFGDNVFDVAMLEAARLAVVVEPKPRLLAHLAAVEAAGEARCAPVRLRVALSAG